MEWLRYLQLVTFRLGPEDMPAGWRATGWALIWFMLTGLAMIPVESTPDRSIQVALGHSLLDNAANALIVLAYAWGWLAIRRRPERLPQLLTALFGALGVLSLVLAAFWWMMPIEPATVAAQGWWVIVLFIWDVLVVGQIFRRALNLGAALGALISLGYFILASIGVIGLRALVFG